MNISNYIESNNFMDINNFNNPLIKNNNIKEENNAFLFLNNHPNNYFSKFKKKYDKLNSSKCEDFVYPYFFSKENIKYIKKNLRYSVFKKTNEKYIIPEQNHNVILNTMEYIYFTYSKQVPYNLKQQITYLDDLVINSLTPVIINNITSRQIYLDTINSPIKLNELPIYENRSKKLIPPFPT